jgi:solute carrier family 25 phosphate transporter 3
MFSGKKIELYSPDFYTACAVGGALSCGLTHAAMTPLDLVKCNAQANPTVFGKGAIRGLGAIYSGAVSNMGFKSGVAGLCKGWAPTAIGYSAQGMCKFGFYEYFKHFYAGFFTPADAEKYKDLIYIAGSASAELIADVALCPFEAVKVRVQTSPDYARGLADGIPKMIKNEGFGTLYAGLIPLWCRQVPYTIIKFVAFERIASAIYSVLPKPKSEMSSTEQMGVVFTSGYIAGILCGIISHPADTLVSKINKVQMQGSIGEKARFIYTGTAEHPGIGFKGLWAGLGPRVVMIGTLTGLQWFIYGAFKAAVGLPTPGDAKK